MITNQVAGRYWTSTYLTFTRIPTADEWSAFRLNSRRVIKWDDRSSTRCHLSVDAVKIIQAASADVLFPHLQAIIAFISGLYPFLMCPSVSWLDIRLVSTFVPSTIYKRVREVMPHLRTLTISYDHTTSHSKIQNQSWASVFPYLHELQVVRLPFRFLDARVAQILSRHKNLEKVISDFARPQCDDYIPLWEMEPLYDKHFGLEAGSFSSLKEFHFAARHITEARSFLTHRFFPLHNLTTLGICLPVVTVSDSDRDSVASLSEDELEEFLRALVKDCLSLKVLKIHIHEEQHDSPEIVRDIVPIGIRCLLPILQFANLATFHIYHPYPIWANNTAIDHFSSQWPHLCGLLLNPCPLIPAATDVTLGALVSLVYNCPEIEEIGLYVNGEELSFIESGSVPTDTRRPFTKETKLWIGHSSLPIEFNAVYNIYPSIARYLTLLPFTSYVWASQNEPLLAQCELWEKESHDVAPWYHILSHRTVEYDRGWRIVAAMVDLILDERRRRRDVA